MKVQEIVRAARLLAKVEAEPPEGLWSKIKARLVSEQLLPVIKVADLFDPFKACPWNHFKFRLSDVRIAIEDGRFQPLPVPDNKRKMNIERIAWFVVNGWSDPISIDVGVPQLQGWNGEHLLDGWHRLGAAIYRKDQDILATVDGSVEYCQEIFNRTTIRLTQGYFATIDEEDFERVSRHKWYAVVERKDNGEILNIYAHTHLKEGTKSLPLHRFLLGLTDPKIVVDHKDHDGLNNKKKNIRPTTDQT